jgi:hypothetical protein
MASMKCPTCGAGTNRLIWLPTLRGDNPVVCCEACRYRLSLPARDRKLYTGKKFWVENDVYTRDQLKEKNHNFEEGVKAQVREQRRTMRPSTRKRLFGE